MSSDEVPGPSRPYTEMAGGEGEDREFESWSLTNNPPMLAHEDDGGVELSGGGRPSRSVLSPGALMVYRDVVPGPSRPPTELTGEEGEASSVDHIEAMGAQEFLEGRSLPSSPPMPADENGGGVEPPGVGKHSRSVLSSGAHPLAENAPSPDQPSGGGMPLTLDGLTRLIVKVVKECQGPRGRVAAEPGAVSHRASESETNEQGHDTETGNVGSRYSSGAGSQEGRPLGGDLQRGRAHSRRGSLQGSVGAGRICRRPDGSEIGSSSNEEEQRLRGRARKRGPRKTDEELKGGRAKTRRRNRQGSHVGVGRVRHGSDWGDTGSSSTEDEQRLEGGTRERGPRRQDEEKKGGSHAGAGRVHRRADRGDIGSSKEEEQRLTGSSDKEEEQRLIGSSDKEEEQRLTGSSDREEEQRLTRRKWRHVGAGRVHRRADRGDTGSSDKEEERRLTRRKRRAQKGKGPCKTDDEHRGSSSDRARRGAKGGHSHKAKARDNMNEGGETFIKTMRMMQAKLPMLRTGSIENYWAFKRQFEDFFLNNTRESDAYKLNQLHAHCDWEVQNYIAHCMALPAERGLKVALETLDERLGDERRYMNHSRELVIRGPKIGENDFQALSTLCAKLTSFISFAEHLGKLSEIDNPPTIRDVMRRLDDAMQNRWNAIWTGKRGKRTPSIKDVLKFVKKETERVENNMVLKETHSMITQRSSGLEREAREETSRQRGVAAARQDSKPMTKPPNRDISLTTQPRPNVRFRDNQVSRGKCRLCNGNHNLPSCETFRSLSIEHRRRVVRAQGRCFMCLSDNHLAKDCRARLCDVNNCNGRHSRWLHVVSTADRYQKGGEEPETYEETNNTRTADSRE